MAVKGDPLEALYVLAITTGMRQGELLALTWENLDLAQGKLFVQYTLARPYTQPHPTSPFTEVKTAAGRRCIELTEQATVALETHRQTQIQSFEQAGRTWQAAGLVFCNPQGKPLHPTNVIQRSFYPLLEKADLPHIRFYDLRHTTATLLLSQNVHPKIVQELLGHSKVAITLDTYSHVLPTLQRGAIDAFSKSLADEPG